MDGKRVFGFLASASGLIEKNVRDIPRMPDDMRVTDAERDKVTSRLVKLIGHSQSLLHLLDGEGS